jgi:hypothetical protein
MLLKMQLVLMMTMVLLGTSAFAEGPFEGQWESDFGILDLKQEGDTVTGTYSCCHGTIAGKINGSRLEFRWQDPVYGTGWGRFTLDGKTMQGVWGYDGTQQANGQWRAVRFSEPHMRGKPSYWTVTGFNAQVGKLTGSAELFFHAKKVTGTIEGRYAALVAGQEKPHDVFNYVDGSIEGTSLKLRWRNPVDQSAGDMQLIRQGDQLDGTWETDDKTARGSIRFVRKAEGEHTAGRSLQSVLDQQTKRQKAEKLLHSAATSPSHQEAIRRYQEAARLFEEVGDWNKVGYAFYGWATDTAASGNYDEAKRLYQKVLDLGEKVEPGIRQLAEMGREFVSLQKQIK